MELKEVIFVDSLPKIDLHGLDKNTARVYVESFITDNTILKNDIICIVHGIGSGILKKEVHETLKKDKRVLNYQLFFNNVGCTIAKIKIN